MIASYSTYDAMFYKCNLIAVCDKDAELLINNKKRIKCGYTIHTFEGASKLWVMKNHAEEIQELITELKIKEVHG